ncbi:hypothetical protein ACFL6S_21950 [Candidatus Poribacteria bacterium]
MRLIRPILRVFLLLLERLYEARRKPFDPPYPYDKRANTISLPAEVEKEIRQIALTESKSQAVKKVTYLTGAGLRVSKDYVANLLGSHRRSRQSSRKRKKRS